MAATQFAADTPLLVMGLLAVGGGASLWRLWIYGLAFLLMGYLLGAAWQRAGVLTDAELTTVRYSARGALTLRVLKAVYYGTVINCVVLAFVMVAAARIFELFLPWHLWLPDDVYAPILSAVSATGIEIASGLSGLSPEVATTNNLVSLALMLSFVGLYSTTGGLRGVIATDVLQLAFMLVGTAAYAIVAVRDAGGMGSLPETLQMLYGDEAERFMSLTPGSDALTAFLVVVSLQWFFQLNSDGTGYLAQRTMACATERDARVAATVFTFAQIVVRSLLWLLIGLALLVVFPFDPSGAGGEQFIAQRELTFARGIDELLPVGIRGLMLTAMLAALASTIDTHLNWGASYWSNDVYKGWWLTHVARREARPGELVLTARLANVVLIGLALAIMSQLNSIQTAWQISLLFGAGVGAVLVLRWLWERINLYCEIAAIAVSLVAAPLLLLMVEADWLRLAIMASLSTLVVVSAALWLPGTEPERLKAFYRRVQPPGWWGRTAAATGEPGGAAMRRLLHGLGAIGACALSVYGLLVGTTQLLLQRADGTTVLLLAAAVAASPLWLAFIRQGSMPWLLGPRG
jgi:Na+/proline symporter